MSFNWLIGKVLMPAAYYLKGDRTFAYLQEYRHHLKMNRKQVLDLQLQKLRKLVVHAYQSVPYYRQLLDSRNISPNIKSLSDFHKIPVLEKTTVLSDPMALMSKKKYSVLKQFSGGSTGNKVLIYKDRRYNEISRAVWYRNLQMLGISPGDKAAWVWGGDLAGPGIWDQLHKEVSDFLNRRIFFNVFRYTDDDIEHWLKTRYNRFRPDYIYGYAGMILEIARVIDKRKLPIVKPRLIVSTSERLQERDYIEKVFGCPVIDQYGSSEVTNIAIEDYSKVMYTSDDAVYVEIGRNKEVLVTPLDSYAMPLLRYNLGDMGMRPRKKSNGTLPFGVFSLEIGRIYEVLRSKSGKKINGGLFKQYAEDHDLEIHEFQVVQHSLDKVVLNIVTDRFTTDKGVDRLKKFISKELGSPKIEVNHLDRFPVEGNGKKIAFKCLIK